MNAIVPHGEEFRQSTDAAGLCGAIVKQTAKNIQGRRFVSVEGWQAIAIAHGCAAGARDVERVEGGVRAIGEVRRMADGQVIATAEGFVGEDEPTWYGGVLRGKTLPKRADYAIRAMAQTRAISRACRSAFAHVVVMIDAGLSTTPAEEVPEGGFAEGQYEEVRQVSPSEPAAPAQAKRTASNTANATAGMPDADWAKLVQLLKVTNSDAGKLIAHYKVRSLRELSPKQYDELVDDLEKSLAQMAKAETNKAASGFGEILDDQIPY